MKCELIGGPFDGLTFKGQNQPAVEIPRALPPPEGVDMLDARIATHVYVQCMCGGETGLGCTRYVYNQRKVHR